ncbi:MAG: AraC family transcriptional regulator, partial [Cyanobacteria bacterium J06626_18]
FTAAPDEQLIHFPEPICDGWMRRLQLRSGIDMVMQNCHFRDDLSLAIQETGNISLLRFGFGIRGETRGKIAGQEQEIRFQAKHFAVGFTTDADTGTIEYAQGQQDLLAVYIDIDTLKAFIGEQLEHLPKELVRALAGQSIPLYLQSGRMTPAMELVIQQVMHCPYQGLTKRLYLEGKVLELLALSLHQITEVTPASTRKKVLNASDVERIHHASAILLSNLEEPPSLTTLSHLVGLNDYKLKVGFRQVFGTTVFGYLYQHRMQQAQALLKTGKCSVSEVAGLVGYTNLSAFSTAFKRKFGVSPNTYKKH